MEDNPIENNDEDNVNASQDVSMPNNATEVYYLKAFRKLEQEGKHTWNWAAFIFQFGWLLYRKMYAYGIIYLISIAIIFSKASSPQASPLIILVLIIPFGLGYYGNLMYYEIVKRRIAKGYHLLDDKYTSTSKFLAFMGICGISAVPRDVAGYFYGFMPLIIGVYYFSDYYTHRAYKKYFTDEQLNVNEETISRYLNQSKSNTKIFTLLISAILFICMLQSSWIAHEDMHSIFSSTNRWKLIGLVGIILKAITCIP